MKNIIYIILASLIFAACKDPNIGPDDDQKPQENAGFIQFESPAVGQKSSFIHFFAKGYYEATPMPLSYTRDTIHWEITKQIDRNTFQITERLAGSYFGDAAINRVVRYITLIKEMDKVLLVTERTTNSPLLGYTDSLELNLNSTMEQFYTSWRVGENNSSNPYNAYLSGYKVKDKEYDKLDIYSDFTPTHYDGHGLLFAYNGSFGMVRHYAMNPWLGDVNGFDLITESNTPIDSKDKLGGTNWKLESVTFKDGTTKSVKEITNPDNNTSRFLQFTINFNEFGEIWGHSGCNEYGGTYSTDNNNLTISSLFATKVYCIFTEEFQMALTNSTTYDVDSQSLSINSSYENIATLNFVKMDTKENIKPLTGSKWKLRAVHYPNRRVLPIEELLGENGSNSAFNEFVLEFMEDNLISGFAGCNTFGGTYKFDQPEIKMEVGNITAMACKFSEEYSKILNAAYQLDANPNQLTIYTRLDGYVALEFDRVR